MKTGTFKTMHCFVLFNSKTGLTNGGSLRAGLSVCLINGKWVKSLVDFAISMQSDRAIEFFFSKQSI